ncbi:MAG: alpha/beta hydrolase [Rothia sp. (in: high G+C Gram-positive bacteria)]|nr:alpha/beta hydrolase [Rothia sp. (in: high G+C Gram-positive bacteria)]
MTTYPPLAPEAAQLIQAFREAGSPSFHTLDLGTARKNYRASCAKNGIAAQQLAQVQDFNLGPFSVRLYQPGQAGGPAPVILFFHGGCWGIGDLDTHDGLCRALAAESGLALVAVDYRLAPEYRYPTAHEDCRLALKWLVGSQEHGLEVSGLVLAGDSAGGQLAAVLAQENSQGQAGLPILAQVLLYPVLDLTMSTDSYRRVTEGYPLVAATMEHFTRAYVPAGVDLASAALSPGLAPLPEGLAPTYLVTVGHDPLADEGLAYGARLARAGVEVVSHHLPGYAHGLFTSAGILAAGQEEVRAAARFIRERV